MLAFAKIARGVAGECDGPVRVRRILRLVVLGLVVPITPGLAVAQGCMGTPTQCGQWAGGYDLSPYLDPTEFEFAHYAVIGSGPNAGKVLLWCRNGSVLPTGPQTVYLWDPRQPSRAAASLQVDSNIFCGGQTWMSDGGLLWVGGTDVTAPSFPVGVKTVRRLDPVAWTISQVPPIAREVWYETVISLADETVLRTGTSPAVASLTPAELRSRELYDPLSGWTPLDDNGFQPDEYPRLHVVQSGKVLMTGYDQQARILDPQVAGPGAWTAPPGLVSSVDRIAGGSVYLSYLDPSGARVERVIVIGGGAIQTPTAPPTFWKSIDVLDNPDAPGSAWQTNPVWDMTWERAELNVVILPNRQILVIGGGIYDPMTGNRVPRVTTEMLDPVALTWKLMGDQRHARMYHSGAGLLPDGRVVSAGGVDIPGFPFPSAHTIEVFSPPYLFAGGAPSITNVPATIGYTGTFPVGVTTFGSPVGTVVLIRAGSSTHHFDFDQRYVELFFTTSGSTLTVGAPPSPGAAPPGYYMLFVVSTAGVPSEAKWVLVG